MSDPVKNSNSLPKGSPEDPLTGQKYDDIELYDNPLPRWWKWLFIASIVFTPLYFFWYHNGAEGRSVVAHYNRALAANLDLQFREIGDLEADRENVIKFLYKDNGKWLTIGESVYRANCVSCHGPNAGGLVGPNLGDDHYKHIKDIGDILRVLQKGANAGAMPAWANRLSDNEIVLVASYVASLRGTFPQPGKSPDGNVIAPWPGPPSDVDETEPSEDDGEQPQDSEAS